MIHRPYYRDMPRNRPVCIVERADGLSVSGPFHDKFAAGARKLGASYNDSWTFPLSVTAEARELAQRCYGEGDSAATTALATIRLRAKRNMVKLKGQVFFHDRVIAAARGRDSGAVVGHDVSLLTGEGISSDGSSVNWCTVVDEGAEFEVRRFARALANSNDDFDVFMIDGVSLASEEQGGVSELQAQETALLVKLAEVQSKLAAVQMDQAPNNTGSIG